MSRHPQEQRIANLPHADADSDPAHADKVRCEFQAKNSTELEDYERTHTTQDSNCIHAFRSAQDQSDQSFNFKVRLQTTTTFQIRIHIFKPKRAKKNLT